MLAPMIRVFRLYNHMAPPVSSAPPATSSPVPNFHPRRMLLSLVEGPNLLAAVKVVSQDTLLRSLGLVSAVNLLDGVGILIVPNEAVPGRPYFLQTTWGLYFSKDLPDGIVAVIVARVRVLLFGRVQEIGRMPQRYIHVLAREGKGSGRERRSIGLPEPEAPPPFLKADLDQLARAAYCPDWHRKTLTAEKLSLSGRTPVRIAVLDSGVDLGHPSLGSFVTAATISYTDKACHGTHITSIISAKEIGSSPAEPDYTKSGYQIKWVPAGLLPGTPITFYKVMNDAVLPLTKSNGSYWYPVDPNAYLAALAQLLIAQMKTGASALVINLSVGGKAPFSTEASLLKDLVKWGALPVAASGNHDVNSTALPPVLYPAALPSCASIGAYRLEMYSASYPPYSWEGTNEVGPVGSSRPSLSRQPVDFYSPGRNILAALPISPTQPQVRPYCDYLTGTSMATAFASAALAYWINQGRFSGPDLPNSAAAWAKSAFVPLLGNSVFIGNRRRASSL